MRRLTLSAERYHGHAISSLLVRRSDRRDGFERGGSAARQVEDGARMDLGDRDTHLRHGGHATRRASKNVDTVENCHHDLLVLEQA